EVLTSRVEFLQEHVGKLPCLTSQQGYPVWCFRNPELARHLLKKRILITDFQYPAEGEAASPSRIVVTAAHDEPQLQYLSEVLSGFKDCQ
ncbi:MAG: hypothetical protein R3252_11875, partial [Robiginitalea sp.]|nr:hypothetical protein [Robiginitalea sp.]